MHLGFDLTPNRYTPVIDAFNFSQPHTTDYFDQIFLSKIAVWVYLLQHKYVNFCGNSVM